MRIPGRSDRLRRRAVDSSKVLQTKRESKAYQKSDYLILVMKPVKVGGAKGVTNQQDLTVKHEEYKRLCNVGQEPEGIRQKTEAG